MSSVSPLRVLVVDDSAFNRRIVADALSAHSEIEIIGRATDGEDAFRQALTLKPDVITLDLEMPKMDGFSFLRLLMARQPTPVIVFSSYAQRENVFKALELGALDFVPKPERLGPDAREVLDELCEKVKLVRSVRSSLVHPPPLRRLTSGAWTVDGEASDFDQVPESVHPAKSLVVFASSTGGPTALLQIFARLSPTTTAGFLVAQHMPDKFTRTFAERLDRNGPVRVTEAESDALVRAGTGFVCPGRQCMQIGPGLVLKVAPSSNEDRYVPSADRLFSSAATSGIPVTAVVLTGMGDDGLKGAATIRAAGGTVICESEETAIVNGMPRAIAQAGLANEVLPLPQIADYLARL